MRTSAKLLMSRMGLTVHAMNALSLAASKKNALMGFVVLNAVGGIPVPSIRTCGPNYD